MAAGERGCGVVAARGVSYSARWKERGRGSLWCEMRRWGTWRRTRKRPAPSPVVGVVLGVRGDAEAGVKHGLRERGGRGGGQGTGRPSPGRREGEK